MYNDCMHRRSVEWPTVAVAATIAAGFASILQWHRYLPAPVVVLALAVLAAWYNSLQHEVVHGHPTRWKSINTAMAIVPLGMVMPYFAYRETHLAHHRTRNLTDPDTDPESFYLSAETWARLGPMRRRAVTIMRTLAGRMVLGPPVLAVNWWTASLGRRLSLPAVAQFVAHAIGVAGVLAVVRMAGLPIWIYVLGVAWCGSSLSLLRSFAEHRFVDGANRSAMVRSGTFFSLLFLNNNLHTTHHARPAASWYALPALSDRLGSDHIAAEGAGLYRGYAKIARHYLLHPFDEPVGPGRVQAASPDNYPITVPEVADGWRRREKAPRLI